MRWHDLSSPSSTKMHSVTIRPCRLYSVICLILVLCGQSAHADIVVLDGMNRTIGKITRVMGARFGPPIPDYGVWGHVNRVDPVEACTQLKPPPETASDWIALIKRQKCDFDIKVLNAQLAGYVAAIVYNDQGNELVPMGSGSQGYKVDIPSAFIGLDDAEYLFENFDKSVEYSIILDSEMPFNVQLYLVPFAIVVGICFVLMLVFMIVKWVRDIRKRRRSRLSKTNLKKIPIKKFKKGDDYDMCAICLDEYEEGDKLRILPCSHGYHQKCIDPWLTKNKKTCPICKRKVVPGQESDSSSSESDSDDDDGGGQTNETTPLLPAQDLRENSLLRRAAGASMVTGGGTFDNSGLPEAVRRCQLAGLAETETASSSDDDDDVDGSRDVAATSWEPGSQLQAAAISSPQHTNTGLHRTSPPPTYQMYDETESCNTSVAEAAMVTEDDRGSPPPANAAFDDMSEDLSENHFAADDDPEAGLDPLGVQVTDPHSHHGNDEREPLV